VNLGLYGHAGAQLIQVALIRVEADPHRQPLYDLDTGLARLQRFERGNNAADR